MSNEIHCQEFHELAMDYRCASSATAPHAYAALCDYIESRLAAPPVASGALPETILPDEFWELVTDCSCTKDLGKSARLLNEWVRAYGQACAAAAAPNAALVEATKQILEYLEAIRLKTKSAAEFGQLSGLTDNLRAALAQAGEAAK